MFCSAIRYTHPTEMCSIFCHPQLFPIPWFRYHVPPLSTSTSLAAATSFTSEASMYKLRSFQLWKLFFNLHEYVPLYTTFSQFFPNTDECFKGPTALRQICKSFLDNFNINWLGFQPFKCLCASHFHSQNNILMCIWTQILPVRRLEVYTRCITPQSNKSNGFQSQSCLSLLLPLHFLVMKTLPALYLHLFTPKHIHTLCYSLARTSAWNFCSGWLSLK